MHPLRQPRHEVVFQTISATSALRTGRSHADADQDLAARALRRLPGVIEAHVDLHGTWAMVTFDPDVTTIAALTGCLAAHGLQAQRMRTLPTVAESNPEHPDWLA